MEGLLVDARPENHFITKDGQRIKNLYQLQKTLLNMNDDVFSHHVNQDRNDFYNWVKDIYKDKALESTVLNCKTKNELAQKLKEKLNEAIRKKKEQDVRKIIEEAKQEVAEKIKEQEKAEKANAEPVPEKKEAKAEERKAEHPARAKREESRKPRTEKHVFVNKPPRTFTKEERPVEINNTSYMKMSLIDFAFGIIIGIIAILIIKQLF